MIGGGGISSGGVVVVVVVVRSAGGKSGEDGCGARMCGQHDWIYVLRQAACCG